MDVEKGERMFCTTKKPSATPPTKTAMTTTAVSHACSSCENPKTQKRRIIKAEEKDCAPDRDRTCTNCFTGS